MDGQPGDSPGARPRPWDGKVWERWKLRDLDISVICSLSTVQDPPKKRLFVSFYAFVRDENCIKTSNNLLRLHYVTIDSCISKTVRNLVCKPVGFKEEKINHFELKKKNTTGPLVPAGPAQLVCSGGFEGCAVESTSVK